MKFIRVIDGSGRFNEVKLLNLNNVKSITRIDGERPSCVADDRGKYYECCNEEGQPTYYTESIVEI